MNHIKASFYLISFLLFFCGPKAFSQGATTNQGREFWTAYMAHVEDNGLSQMSLYITADVNTTGTVASADGDFSIPFTVTARQVTTVNIPRSAFLPTTGQFLKGIHIIALKNVAVYAHIYAQSVSGATLLLPVSSLGKSYTSINFTQLSNSRNSYSTFSVIATEDNTTVEINPSANLISGEQTGTPFQISLKKGEVYQGFSGTDLTGTLIRSVSTASGECKKIAVFSGSSKIGIGCSNNSGRFSSDNFFQQVYPTASWGKNYLTAPLKSRNYDIYRVVLSDLNTIVKVNGVVVIDGINAAKAAYYQFKSQQANVITANKPIQVVQYAVTQGNHIEEDCNFYADDIGDPEMIYLTPLEQTLDHVTLYSTSNYQILNNFINVVIKTSAVSTFMLDNAPYADFIPIADDPNYSYAQITVGPGTHYINAAEGFNAIAYGFGRAESYGYAAGTNLQNLNEFINIADKQTSEVKINGCAGIAYKLQLTIPYQTTSIKWDFNDGTAPYIDNSPVVRSTIQKDAKTLYTYEYFKTLTFTAGDYTVTGTVRNPTADDCGTDESIDFNYNIGDPPETKFISSGSCEGDSVLFTDTSNPKTSTVKSWLWDFGDGQASVLQNPRHVYGKGGTYNVRLTVVSENGCSATTNAIPLKILNKPKPVFKLTAPYCPGQLVTVTDQSTSADGVIKTWTWDFGDGTPLEVRTDNKVFTHVFLKPGIDTVKLAILTDNGCTSVLAQQVITLTPLPLISFTLPDVCLADATAQFSDKSTVADHTESGFTYLWNFGDANANAANPNTSTQKNAKHKYTRAANYTVTLTVTTASGCPYSASQLLTVNGDVPKALFTVDDKDKLCSANTVIFHDQSTINFGNLTKIVWYYDYANQPQTAEVFNRSALPASRTYQHLYGLFNTPLTKTYTVRMEAYSGETCVDVSQQDIVVNANPLVTVSKIGAVCYNDAPVQITADHTGFTGTEIFSGKGVSATGLFDPHAARAGVTTITYKFTTLYGCAYINTQNITVYDELTASAGDDLTLLEGGSATLKATSNQTGLVYKWLPATGLSRDDVLNPVASPLTDLVYTLTVTNLSGCTVTDNVMVSVLKNPLVVNTFTPNNDGINDVWNIKYLESYPGCTVDIYNRQGEKVYSSVGYAIPWDGRYRGAELPAATYYYMINPKNGRKVVAGSVTILR